ncbi:methionyl-tRNA formyltransferase [Rhodobacteraceae bacterium NNCM2]|nr:methionyl-tRNA formyltransferase [Coraliihabitans acroporae]
MRLVFMGTPDFSVPVLDALVEAGHEICRVYSQPPRRAGRGKQLRPSPVHARAEALGLEVATPERFRGEVVDDFAALKADAAVVVAYGQILPQAALDAPARGCLNLHASLLPRWRGAAPIQRAIMAGDAESGVCVMQMEAGLDTGPVLAREATPIGAEDTAVTLHDRLAAISARLIVKTLPILDDLTPEVQAEDGVTYAAKIDKAEARIDWTLPASKLSAHIRGLSPFPGAWCEIGGQRVKVLMAVVEEGAGRPGAVLDDRLLVAAGAGAVRLTRLQPAGKGAMEAAAFLSGRPVKLGEVLS